VPWVGFEPTIPAFERAKTVQALDRAVNVIGMPTYGLAEKLHFREVAKLNVCTDLNETHKSCIEHAEICIGKDLSSSIILGAEIYFPFWMFTFVLPGVWMCQMKLQLKFIRFTKWLPHYPDVNPLDSDVWTNLSSWCTKTRENRFSVWKHCRKKWKCVACHVTGHHSISHWPMEKMGPSRNPQELGSCLTLIPIKNVM
jgi:hypothetical protein